MPRPPVLDLLDPEDRRAKTHAPDAEDIPGEDSSKDWKTIVEGKVRGRIRPPVVVEAKALPVGDDPSRAVVVVRVEEGPDAPHEVYASSGEGRAADGGAGVGHQTGGLLGRVLDGLYSLQWRCIAWLTHESER